MWYNQKHKTMIKVAFEVAIIREDNRLVDSAYLNENYDKRSVLLVFNGEKLPVGQGYLAYSSNATTSDEARADQVRLGDLLVNMFDSDGKLSSGWGGIEELCIL